MPFVVDASVVACWLLPDERHPIAAAAYTRIAVDSAVLARGRRPSVLIGIAFEFSESGATSSIAGIMLDLGRPTRYTPNKPIYGFL